MSKYILPLLFLFISFDIIGQDPITTDSETLDLETEFITAMQDVALEEYDDALVKFKKIKNKVSDDGIVDFEIAKIYLVKNEVEESEIYIKKAILKDDSKIIYKLFLLDILKKQHNYPEAAELMEDMLSNRNYERVNYFRTASLYQRAKNTKKALEVLDRLEKRTGYDKEVVMHRVSILLRSKNYKKGLKVINKLISKQGEDIKTLTKKAMIFRLMNNNKKALETYNLVIKLDPQNPVASSYIHARNKFQQKEEDYIKGLQPILKNKEILLDDKIKMLIPFISKASKESLLTKELEEASSLILNQYPTDAKANALHGDILYNSGNIKESITYYKASLKDSKKNFEIWKQLMTIYSYLENWVDLAKISNDAIDYYPNQVLGYYNAGKAYLNLGKTQKGLDLLEEAIMYTSNRPVFRNEVVLLQSFGKILDNNIEEASGLLENLDDRFKEKHPYYWELKGDIEKNKSNVDKAKEFWGKSLKLGNTTDRLLTKLRN